MMPRNITATLEDDIIARRYALPTLARSTPFNRPISCELKSLRMCNASTYKEETPQAKFSQKKCAKLSLVCDVGVCVSPGGRWGRG
jgi:hypothetical protein